jgi:[protein-PII] uridylyltransferase
VSQRRDLTDRKVIEDVARTVGNLHALEDLALLTVADMSAVGPGRFTEWKAQLLAEILDRVANVFAEGLDTEWPLVEARQSIAVAAKAALVAQGDGGLVDGLDAFLTAMPHRYLLRSTPERIVDHFRLFAGREPVSVHFASDTDEHFTELAVSTDDRPGTLLTIAGVLSASSVNILTAEIVTSPSARTLDVFRVQTATGNPLDDEGKRARVTAALTEALQGETDVAELIRGRRADVRSGPAMPSVPTVVSVDQRSSDRYTVVEIKTRDRIGLLWEIASALFSEGCSIVVSRIVTEGIRVIDVFYVEHAGESRKLTDSEAAALGASLSAVLAGPKSP